MPEGPPDRSSFRTGVLAGLAHAALMALAFPRPALWPFALLAVTPLVLAARRTARPLRLAAGVALGSVPFWWLTHWWVWDISDAGLPVLLMYLSLWPGLFVWVMARVPAPRATGVRIIWSALVWTAVEAVRADWVWGGYAWYLVGQPLIETPVTYLAPAFGVHGASFVAAAFGCTVAELARSISESATAATPRRAPVPRLAMGLLLAFALLWLPLRPSGWSGRAGVYPLRVAVVQTNVPQSNKMAPSFDQRMADFSTALRLTTEAAHGDHGPSGAPTRPDVIVWPETSFPGTSLSPEVVEAERASGLGYRQHNYPLTGWHDDLTRVQRDLGIPLVVGAIAVEGFRINTDDPPPLFEFDRTFNSAFLITEGEVRPERTDKVHLTPFGETMPLISRWAWLERQLLALGAGGMTFDLSEGVARTLAVPLGDGRPVPHLAVPICFEATSPSVVREMVYPPDRAFPRAGVIVNLTNDAWLGGSVAARLNHLLAARWRCVELGVPMVRCANSGASCHIDASGRVRQIGPNDQASDGSERPAHGSLVEGVMSVTVEVSTPPPGARGPVLVRAVELALPTCGVLLMVAAALRARIESRRGLRSGAAPG